MLGDERGRCGFGGSVRTVEPEEDFPGIGKEAAFAVAAG